MNSMTQREQRQLRALYLWADKRPDFDRLSLRELEPLSRLLLAHFSPAETAQILQPLLGRRPSPGMLREIGQLDTGWMSASTCRRFIEEMIRLWSMPGTKRRSYINQHESWRQPLDMFMQTPQRLQALEVLELVPPCSEMQVKQSYRRLAQRAHPDRGGDPELFMRLQSAYLTALQAF